jgi:hypothetical protein
VEVSCGGFVDEGFCQGRGLKEGSGEVGHICGRFGDGKTGKGGRVLGDESSCMFRICLERQEMKL